jgi:uncharacterized membrane protein YraQ (UPF0718 family)
MTKKRINLYLILSYFLFLLASAFLGFKPGKAIGANFTDFIIYMIKILPCAFVLIGLFEVWIKKEKVEKHLGEGSGLKAHLYAILLASLTVGGIYVALPVAHTLFKKGADLEVVFTYVGTSGAVRIPMTLFEALFMGLGFAIWRRLFLLPLIVLSSILLTKYLKKRHYKLIDDISQ